MDLWLIFVLLSAVLLAAFILMLRRDVMHEPNTQVISIYPLSMVFLLPVMSIFTGVEIDYSLVFSSQGVLVLVKTVAIAISLFCTTMALKFLPLSAVGPLRNLGPLFVALLGLLLLGETLSLVNTIGLFVIVCGVILLDFHIRDKHAFRHLFSSLWHPATLLLIFGAISISFVPVIDRVLLGSGINILTLLFHLSWTLASIYWVLHIIEHKKLPVSDLSFHELLWLLLTGVVLLLADILYLLALSFPAVAVAVVIGVRRLSDLFVTLFGGAILHEEHGLYRAGICLLMVFGVVLLVL